MGTDEERCRLAGCLLALAAWLWVAAALTVYAVQFRELAVRLAHVLGLV